MINSTEKKPWLKFYDEAVSEHLDYPLIPIFEMLRESARRFPQQPCTVFKGAVITYQQMDVLTDRVAAALVKMGVKKGERVGILMPNIPQFVVVFFAILKAGGVVVSINPLFTAREIEHQVNDSGVKVMFVMSKFYKLLKQVQPHTSLQTLIVSNIKEALPSFTRFLFTLFKEKKDGHRVTLDEGDLWMQSLENDNVSVDVDVNADDFAVLQYSGGTTGVPKGAIGLHRNLVANAIQVRTWMCTAIDGKETTLMAIPLFHIYGMVVGMMVAVRMGAGMVMVPNPRDMDDMLSNLQKYRATIFPGVPTLYNAINNYDGVRSGKYDLRSIKLCISGSAPLMRETKLNFEALSGGKLIEGYGLSESPTATHCNPVLKENRIGSIGLPFPDVECRIVDLDNDERILEVGQIGELVVRGPQVFYGYHNMPEETATTLRDGWLYTGDIARMDEDGYFYIVDRKKELIKPGGFQVWPREVEEVIMENPKVLEVGVSGIPDVYRGETVKAWIVPKQGETLTNKEIKDWCKERLAKYKIPTHIEFRKELPKTIVGKILKRELVRQHKEMSENG